MDVGCWVARWANAHLFARPLLKNVIYQLNFTGCWNDFQTRKPTYFEAASNAPAIYSEGVRSGQVVQLHHSIF